MFQAAVIPATAHRIDPIHQAPALEHHAYDWLLGHGPAFTRETALGMGVGINTAARVLGRLCSEGALVKGPGGYSVTPPIFRRP